MLQLCVARDVHPFVVRAMDSAFSQTLFFVSSYNYGITVSEKCNPPGMSYFESSARIMLTNPLFSNIENGLISFTIKTPIELVISPCLGNDLGYLLIFIRPKASGKRSCPVHGDCFFFVTILGCSFHFLIT